MEITRESKTIVSDDLYDEINDDGSFITVQATVDHLDNERPFCLEFNENFNGGWVTSDQMKGLKKLIDKAVSSHKAGFKV